MDYFQKLVSAVDDGAYLRFVVCVWRGAVLLLLLDELLFVLD